MKVRIHRGEIGGNCIEVEAEGQRDSAEGPSEDEPKPSAVRTHPEMSHTPALACERRTNQLRAVRPVLLRRRGRGNGPLCTWFEALKARSITSRGR